MKKIIFSLAILLGCTLSVSAQEVLSGRSLLTVPSFFTFNHTPYLLSVGNDFWKQGTGNIDIYDTNFNQISSVNINNTECWELESYIDKNGISYDLDDDEIFLTQTLFNDDADWEYVEPVGEKVIDEWGYLYWKSISSYTIKKIDGTVLGNISPDKWLSGVLVIDNVVYVIRETYNKNTDESTTYLYTLPEYRKFISSDPNGVEAVPAMVHTVSKEAHDLMGRKVSEHHKGIVIKDGKKMINK